jgi:hypothetical protein
MLLPVDICSVVQQELDDIIIAFLTSDIQRALDTRLLNFKLYHPIIPVQQFVSCTVFVEQLDDIQTAFLTAHEKGADSISILQLRICSMIQEKQKNIRLAVLEK